MPLLAGQYLGNYSMLELIGQGGYAEVYRCEHRSFKSERAMKVVEKVSLTKEEQENFLNEARIHSQMQHANIIRVYDSGEVNGYFFLVMDYVPATLSSFSGQQLQPSTIVPFVQQCADALYYIHNKNIVHCDVKPENMLLNAHQRLQLCDFGIAVDLSSPTKNLYGTIEYVSPERLRGRPCPASDQYALAVTVYLWLSGAFPFDDQRAILSTKPVSLCQKIPALAPAIEQVVFKGLSKEPQDRFPDILTFARQFEHACRFAQPASSPVSSFTSAVFPPTRKLAAGIPPLGTIQTPTRPILPKPLVSKLLYTYRGHRSGVNALAWSPDGKQLVSASMDRSVKIWDAMSGSDMLTYRGHSRVVWNLLWSYDGSRIASADEVQAVRVWDALTGDTWLLYQHRVGPPDEVGVALDYSMAWSRDGEFIISASDDQPLEKWNTRTGKRILAYKGHTTPVRAISWSPDETKIVTGSGDRTIYVWDAVTGTIDQSYQNHRGSIRALAWSPDGSRIASADSNGIIHVWHAMTGKSQFAIVRHRPRSVNSLVWSPDGSKIASASSDKTVRVWDATSGTLVESCQGHADTVNMVAWSPASNAIASASDDGTVRVWAV